MGELYVDPAKRTVSTSSRGWYRELNRYHWFVLSVAALGWMFDCLDQQLFALSRLDAMKELLPAGQSPGQFGGYATAVFLLGWATGGLMFGVLGDRVGRAKTMLLCILMYSLCTGLSAVSWSFWSFAFFRFLTGLGVGGEFAVGVSLVAEVMPDRARPHALALLQALSAIGNITAALIGIGLSQSHDWLGQWHLFGITLTPWRAMFLVGALPAFLALAIFKKLKEPERWQAVAHEGVVEKQLGSYSRLFGDPRWRRRALCGMILAASGVVGLWGIGFFSPELNRSVFRPYYEQEARAHGAAENDRRFVAGLLADPKALDEFSEKVRPADLLSAESGNNDASAIYGAALELHKAGTPITAETLLSAIGSQTAEQRSRRTQYLQLAPVASLELKVAADDIVARNAQIAGALTLWAAIALIMQNSGGACGMYLFSHVGQRFGRRPTFAICFIGALISTAVVFSCMSSTTIMVGGHPIFVDVFWLIPIMGFWQLSLFSGYAIYFPELFPTYLRSTGTSFCYNVGRFVAAAGPYIFGTLTVAFAHTAQPFRWAGVSMCSIFLLGVLILPLLPETKGQPLPE